MVLYVDGGCSGNAQLDFLKRRMVWVVTDEEGTVLAESLRDGGSNNIAELLAVEAALQWCVDRQVDSVIIRTDSRNNLAWVFGKKVGMNINDRQAVLAIKAAIAKLRESVDLTLEWIPRERNKAGHYIERAYGE